MGRRRKSRKRCHKVEYHNEDAARRALNDFGRQRGSKRFYKCPHHEGRDVWHLTSEGR